MTEWREIPGYEGRYAVSDDSQVKSLERTAIVRNHGGYLRHTPERLLRPTKNVGGYLHLNLFDDDGNKRSRLVHRLVLMAFVGPCPSGMEGCHNDGNRLNNHVGNLRWDTHRANVIDQVLHGVHPWRSITHCPQGHPYDEENTYNAPSGSRHCRTCRRAYSRRRTELGLH